MSANNLSNILIMMFLKITRRHMSSKTCIRMHHMRTVFFISLGFTNCIFEPSNFSVISCSCSDIILLSPCWTTYAPQAKLAGKKSIAVETSMATKWKATKKALEEAIGKSQANNRLLILNNPGNPCK